jgi:YHS domain-containing protein/uncharacterized membrane protein YraQ (UPF0718 family)
MFFDTLWPLILGFTLAGAVQAFVSRDTMLKKMGDHGPASIARSTGYGMVSSSCSYAASAMSKSLFVKGADFVAALVFMFASTNLVLELGIVLIVLMGWQFAASEFVGGFVMITLLVLFGSLWLRGRSIEQARERLQGQRWLVNVRKRAGPRSVAASALVAEDPFACGVGQRRFLHDGRSDDAATRARHWLPGGGSVGRSRTGQRVERPLLARSRSVDQLLENAIVGPLVAIVSFVCSIGNVPLAAALWHGGISFGGVIAFLFADLIAFPLLLIYRRYYGTQLMLRMLGLFWLVMSLAGLATEAPFRSFGAVPTERPDVIVSTHVTWNYTTFLNLAFLVLFLLLYWVFRHRDRFGAGEGYALDPVCGMQVETAHAPASTSHAGTTIYFCSDHCRLRFDADPQKSLDRDTNASHDLADESGFEIDPVCAMSVDPAHAADTVEHNGLTYYFCAVSCAERFRADPVTILEGDRSAWLPLTCRSHCRRSPGPHPEPSGHTPRRLAERGLQRRQ